MIDTRSHRFTTMKMTRRRFISFVSITSISSGCMQTSGKRNTTKQQSNETSYETTSIVVSKSGNKVVETEQVPIKWKNQSDRAKKVHQIVEKRYGTMRGIKSIEIVNSPKTIGEYHYSAIEVAVVPNRSKEINEKIPNKIKNVDVNVVERKGTAVPA